MSDKLKVKHRRLRLGTGLLLGTSFTLKGRKLLGMSEEWGFMFSKRTVIGKISWNTFDPVSHHPQPLPPVPREWWGECEGIQRTLRSAEVYEPNTNRWSFVADMSKAMVSLIDVVYYKQWFLKGQVISGAFDRETNSWSLVSDGMVTGWRNTCARLDGGLYGLDCRDGW